MILFPKTVNDRYPEVAMDGYPEEVAIVRYPEELAMDRLLAFIRSYYLSTTNGIIRTSFSASLVSRKNSLQLPRFDYLLITDRVIHTEIYHLITSENRSGIRTILSWLSTLV